MIEKINSTLQAIIMVFLLGVYAFALYQSKVSNYPKYISSSTLLFHLYNIILLSVCLIEAILHKQISPILKKNFRFLISGSGKGFIVNLIALFFLRNEEKAFMYLGIIFICGGVALYVIDQFLSCNIDHLKFNKTISQPDNFMEGKVEEEKKKEEVKKDENNPYNIPEDF